MADNQQLPIDPYQPLSNTLQKDDAFYSSFSDKEDTDPIETYTNIGEELDTLGQSPILENARIKWEKEQDQVKKGTIGLLLNDDEISREEKKLLLDDYLNNEQVPLSFKDKYLQTMSDEYLLNNELETNNKVIEEEDNKIQELKVEQAEENIKEKSSNVFNDMMGFNIPVDNLENNWAFAGLATGLPETTEENQAARYARHVITEPLALIDGMIGIIPWGVEAIETLLRAPEGIDAYIATQAYREVYDSLDEADQKAYRKKGINQELQFNVAPTPEKLETLIIAKSKEIKANLVKKHGKNVDTVTAMYEYLTEQNRKKGGFMWAGLQQDAKDSLGINKDLEETVVANVFKWIDEQINKGSSSLKPDDPELVGLPVKLLVAAFLPKTVKTAVNVTKKGTYKALRTYADTVVAKRKQKQKDADSRALPPPRELKDVTGEVLSPEPPVPPKPPTTGPQVNIKVDSPIASTTRVNPKKGAEINATFVLQPEVGPAVGLDLPKFLSQSLDGNGTLVGTNQIGSQMDVRLIPEVLEAAERQRELTLLDPLDIYYNQKKDFLMGVNETRNSINNIKSDVKLIVSPTFSTAVPLDNASGFFQSTVIRHSSVSNFTNKADVEAAYAVIKKEIMKVREEPLAQGELVIEKVITTGQQAWNVLDTYVPTTSPKVAKGTEIVPEVNDGGTYIIRWSKEMDQGSMMIEDYQADFGTVPSKRTNKLDAAVQNALSIKMGNSGAQFSEWFSPYGQFTRKFESLEGLYKERAEYYKDAVKDEMIEYVLKDLSARQQRMFGTAIEYLELIGKDTASVGELRTIFDKIAPEYGTPRTATLEKIKRGLDSMRIYINQNFVTANLIENSKLRAAGYDKAFYVIDPVTKVETVLPVLKDFKIQRSDPIFFDEAGQPLSIEIYDLKNQRPVLFEPNVRDYLNKEGVFTYNEGLRQHQVYRVNKAFIDKDGRTYDYLINPGLLPNTLPTITIPRKPGYTARIHESTLFGVKYPLSHIHNGKEMGIFKDKQTGEVKVLAELDYGNEYVGKLTKEQQTNRDLLTQQMDNYSQTVVARDTVNEMEAWERQNPSQVAREVLDGMGDPRTIPGVFLTIKRQAKEISSRELKSYYETEASTTSTSKYRNELLDSKVTGDPFRSTVLTGNQINSNFMTQQFLKQAEDIFVNLYVVPGNQSSVTIRPNAESPSITQTRANELETINKDFPLAREQIQQKMDNVEEYKQALRMYDKITVAKYGTGNKASANVVRTILDQTTNAVENNIIRNVVPEKMLDGIVVKLRAGQKYSDIAVQLPSTLTVQLMIMMRPFRQLFIQAPVFTGALLTASGFDPVRFTHNLKDITALAALDGMNAYWKDSPAWSETYKYIWENTKDAPPPLTIYQEKFGRKYDVSFNKEFNFGKLSSHEWLPNIFTRDVTELGNVRSSTELADIINPKSWAARIQRGLAKGFQIGEGLGRDGMLPVMVRNWMYKNPDRAHQWKSPENVKEWMEDAIKGVGFMTPTRQLGWQKYLPFEMFAKFEGFSQKQAAVIWNKNASGFQGSRRYQYIFSGLLLTGTLPYALQTDIRDVVGEIGKLYGDKEREFEEYFSRLNLADYWGNVWANQDNDLSDEERQESKLDFGESLGLFGFEDYPFFFWSRAAEYLGLMGDKAGDSALLGAVVAQWNILFGENKGFNLMVEFWSQPEAFTFEERVEGTARLVEEMLPFLKPVIKYQAEAYLGDRYTVTGQPTGTGTSESENFIVNMLGVQDYADQFVWDSKRSQKDKQKAIQSAARTFMVMVNKITNDKPTWNDVKKRMNVFELELQERKFLSNSMEHQSFKREVRRIIQKQNTPLMLELYKYYTENVNMDQKYFSEEEIRNMDELATHLKGKYPDEASQIDYRVKLMKARNKVYEQQMESK